MTGEKQDDNKVYKIISAKLDHRFFNGGTGMLDRDQLLCASRHDQLCHVYQQLCFRVLHTPYAMLQGHGQAFAGHCFFCLLYSLFYVVL